MREGRERDRDIDENNLWKDFGQTSLLHLANTRQIERVQYNAHMSRGSLGCWLG
jgi:hypothetical protein